MRSFICTSIAVVAFTILAFRSGFADDCSSSRSNRPPYAELAKIFRYDPTAPLELNVLSSIDENGVTVESIEFKIDATERCSAAMVIPKRRKIHPAVVWLGSGDKDWTPYAVDFSRRGAISIVLDYCGNAPAFEATGFYQDEVRTVIAIRRSIDILIARKDVDHKRIAFVGHSGGAMLGADAVAIDGRFRAAVFESGLQGFTYHICTSPHPFAVGIRQQLGDRLPEYVKRLAPLDAILYVGHEAPTALLFQSAALDKGVPRSDAQAFFEAASEPKQIIWYNTGHEMKIDAVDRHRTKFLEDQLEMK
jgi:cephalosporin-C deacetylase-like acetyl esterase